MKRKSSNSTSAEAAKWTSRRLRWSLLVPTCVALIFAVIPSVMSAQEQEPEAQVDRKAARSEFNIEEFRDFVSYDLSRPQPTGSLRNFGIETRKVYGQLVDHEGIPIANAQVVISEPIGYSGQCYDENFDKTDDLGRFVLEGHIRRNRIAIRREAGKTWGVPLEPGQQSIRIVWPKPAKLLISVDAKLCEAESILRIQSSKYWIGMTALQRTVKLDDKRSTTVEELLPGDYAILTSKTIQVGEKEIKREVEIGRFAIEAGESKTVKLTPVGRVPVSGTFKADTYVIVGRQKEDYHDVAPCVDLAALNQDGTFEAGPFETGRYVLSFYSPVDPKALPARGEGFGRGFGGGFSGGDQLAWTTRITITVDDMEITLSEPEKPQDIAAFVSATLDTQDPMASWSHSDVQAAQLSMHAEKEQVVAELLRILDDPHSPEEWSNTVLKALGNMADSPLVVNGVLNLVRKPEQEWSRPWMIKILEESKYAPEKVAEAIAVYRKSDDLILRSSTFSVLGRLASKNPDLQPEIIPWLIEAMDDPDDITRYNAAATLGQIKAESALPKLYEARQDPSGAVAVWSAWAIWQIDGSREQAIEIMTEKLHGEDYNGKQHAIMQLAEFDAPAPETIAALVELTKFESKPPYNGDRLAKLGFKQTAIQTLKKIAPQALPEAK